MTAYRKVPAGVKWLRVTKQAKCPVPGCNHDGWCFISSDGAESLCMRVQSNREYHFKDGKVGWIHSVNGRVGVPVVRAEKPKPVINTGRLMQEWKAATKPEYLLYLSNTLSIPASVLTDFEFAYCARNGATAIPMRDGYDCYTGIRLRFPNAEYRSIPGSSPGLFIPRCRPETFWDGGQRLILACEGGTSAAAGLSLGWWTVGTANAGQGAGMLQTLIRRLGIRYVAVVADNKIDAKDGKEDRGLAAAQSISRQMPCRSCVIVLPCKDLRAGLQLGMTADLISSLISSSVWRCNS